ncbi:DUF192 domain-containing protein [Halalkalibacter alkalisediminis]|uniref:DUF192 domain-containing protein n=1 Tax=Halalkalibacter alkalisediminis TaxID=935616 RepID=A0ABV6NM90_9BACI|nr:DUF192 domain-containing protein [Halalkalibacter alkalisediminis]
MKCYVNEAVISEKVSVAATMFSRAKGLLGKKELPQNESILLTPCNQVHTYFMLFTIDCVFLDSNDKVIHLIERLKPWSVSSRIPKATDVLELPEGSISKFSIYKNQYLSFKD